MINTKHSNIVIVMPAYKAVKTVRETYKEIAPKYRKNIILVDDSSGDGTTEVAKKLGIKVFEHTNNLGYGGNQKTCYWEALKLNPDVVVMLHPDYQYDATKINDLVSPVIAGEFDFMFGSRIKNRGMALAGGMPKVKYYINRLVCLFQNILLGENFSEYFSGFRAYSSRLLKMVPFQRFSNDFAFDQEMMMSAISYGFKIGEIPIPTRYHNKASSIGYLKGIKFIVDGFLVIAAFYLFKLGLSRDGRFKH
ncbi:MAG: glycosyltransferase family 2 protein [Candidatus Woesebacteria bacterium]|nr:glycosyltransferase family 2 protein [Candidatus Woesebacteria bacterium]